MERFNNAIHSLLISRLCVSGDMAAKLASNVPVRLACGGNRPQKNKRNANNEHFLSDDKKSEYLVQCTSTHSTSTHSTSTGVGMYHNLM